MKALYDSVGRRLVGRRSEFLNLHPLHKLQKQFALELTSSVRQQLDWRTEMGENLRHQHSGYRGGCMIRNGDRFSPLWRNDRLLSIYSGCAEWTAGVVR